MMLTTEPFNIGDTQPYCKSKQNELFPLACMYSARHLKGIKPVTFLMTEEK
jgi:hypothetical protein